METENFIKTLNKLWNEYVTYCYEEHQDFIIAEDGNFNSFMRWLTVIRK